MSSPATAAFLAAFRQQVGASKATLAKIELTVPSSLTLRYATSETVTADGTFWQAGLIADPIRHTVGYLGPGVSPADATIRLVRRRDASQSSGTVHDLLSDYLWQNATVTIYLWERSLTDFADALQVFKGVVSRPAHITPEGMTLHLLQEQSWNVQTPPTVVDKTSYPDSPDVSQGLPVPIVYGDHIAPPMRSPWGSSYGSKQYQEDSGAGLGVVPGVLVDAGVGGSSVKVVYAGHACADILARASGYSQFIVGSNTLAPLDTTGLTETLGASESYIALADENAVAYTAIIPIDVRASENTATDPRRAMDPFDETTYATLNQGAAKNELQLILPNEGPLGRIESVQYYVAWSGNAGNANNLRIRSRTPGVGFGTTSANWVATSTTLTVQTGTWSTSDWTQDWDFGGSATVYDVRVDFTGGAANQARIYWVALVVKYRPQRSVVTPGKTVLKKRTVYYPGPRGGGGEDQSRYMDRPHIRNSYLDIPTTFELESQFYANIKGYADDGGGTYTGAAAALIQRPPDIMRHFLVTYGGVTGSDIETGTSTTGSFVDARSTLRNAAPTDAKLAVWLGERTTIQRAMQTLAEQSGSCVYLDRFTNKWLCFVWKPGATADYDRSISYYETSGLQAEETSVVDVRHAIRIKYGRDYYKNKTLYEAFVTSASSGQGVNLPTIRDQRLTVTAGSNDDIDFKVGAVTYAAVLTAATYTPIDLADEARNQCRTAGGNNIDAGYGFSIKTGMNDLLDFIVGGVPFQATLAEADYTAEGLATEVARAMNAVSSTGRVFACTYAHSTNKFTISATGGTFQVDPAPAAAGYTQSTVHVLGQSNPVVAATSLTMETARYGDRFWFFCGDSTTTINMLWGSGASASTNAAWLMGYSRGDSGNTRDNPAAYARGDRERVADTYEGYYGPKEERQITADWIRDESTAVELRNRIFDLTARPRVLVRFATHRMPDVRVMQVIELASDVDPFVAYPKYGSDGSWSGKPLRVLEVEQHLGPSYHTEVLAIGAE